jgi:hypothetical protein
MIRQYILQYIRPVFEHHKFTATAPARTDEKKASKCEFEYIKSIVCRDELKGD